MFYLEQFKRTFILMPGRFILLFLLSWALFYSFAQKESFYNYVSSLVKAESKSAYFNALLSASINPKEIQRKVIKLPGVKRVSIINETDINREVKKVVKDLKVESEFIEKDLSLTGIRVEFEKTMQLRSQELIRDYVARLSGKDNITLGALHRNPKGLVNKSIYIAQMNFNLAFWGVASLLILLWISLFHSIRMHIKNLHFILSRFQRRKNLRLCVNVLLLAAVAIIPLLIVSVMTDTNKVFSFSLVALFTVIIFIPEMAKPKWKN